MSMAAIRGLMEDGEGVLAQDIRRKRNGDPSYTRYAYSKVRATFDAHDMVVALDGRPVRMTYRQTRPAVTHSRHCGVK